MRAAVSMIALVLFALAGMSLHAEDWPMYGRDLSHTFSNKQSQINAFNVWRLKRAWSFPTGDAVSASPTVVDGVVYVGSWEGFFYALKANSSMPIVPKWKYQVDCQCTVVPVPQQCMPKCPAPKSRALTDGGIITSSAAVVETSTPKGRKPIVYFGAGKTLYALYADTGELFWKRVICGNPQPGCESDVKDPTRIFSSPAIFGGMVFVGDTADGAAGYSGGFEAIDAATGKVLWHFEVDPGGNNRGCGSVWSSAAVDPDRHLVFFDTGDCNNDATPPFHEAIIALDYSRQDSRRHENRPGYSVPARRTNVTSISALSPISSIWDSHAL